MAEEIDLNALRQRVLKGETIPREEYTSLIAKLRVKRNVEVTAAADKKEKREKAKAGTSDEELRDILGLG